MKTKATRRRMISCFAQIINGYVLLEFTHFLWVKFLPIFQRLRA